MNTKRTHWLAVGMVWATVALASDATNDPVWKTTLTAGGTLTDGNTETMKGNASLLVEGEKASLGSLRTGAEINYGENKVDGENRTDTDNGKVFANVKKTISPMTFAYGDVTASRDDLANLDYRIVLGPGLGLYAVKSDRTTLSFEAGPSYKWEKKDRVSDDAWTLRAAQRFEFKFSDTSRCWQAAEFLAQFEDLDDNLLNAEVGVEADIMSGLSLRLVVEDKYDNQPSEGKKSNDVSVTAGISLKL